MVFAADGHLSPKLSPIVHVKSRVAAVSVMNADATLLLSLNGTKAKEFPGAEPIVLQA